MVWYGMVWYGMAWQCIVWYGMVWYSMVGIARHGMTWHGTSTVVTTMVWYGMLSNNSFALQTEHTRNLREGGVNYSKKLFNIPYAHAHSARLASFHCNGRPRARAPIIITILTTNIHANTKNGSLYVRKVHNTCEPYQRKTK